MKNKYMKELIPVAAALLLMSTAHAQQTKAKKYITVQGKVQFLNPEPYTRFNKVWLEKDIGGERKKVDSVSISPDGSWQLKILAPRPSFYSLDIAAWDRASIYTDANLTIHSRGYDTAKIKIKNPPYVFVEGSDANNFINLVEHAVYRNYQTQIAESRELYFASQSKDSAWNAYLKIKDPFRLLNEDFNDRIKVLIRAYHDKPVVIYALGMLNWEANQDIIMPILGNLNKKYPWFKDAAEFQKTMEDRIAQAKLLKPGKPIPAVSYPDAKGSLHGFDQYRGNYLLIDFWASWCGPCRQAIPKVKALYTKYKDQGFDVVSISIDDSRQAWVKAMDEEQMPWQQLLSPDKQNTMKTFLFSGIPTLYLVDREGKIVGSYTGFTDHVQQRIEQLFTKK
jgi:thiol-disulfide isomerase/thioredoxin